MPGREILNGKITTNIINIAELPSGMYFLRVANAQETASMVKFVKK